MLSKISQRERDKYYVSLHVESMQGELKGTDTGIVVTRGQVWGKRDDVSQSTQTSSFKMNKFQGSNVQHGDCT